MALAIEKCLTVTGEVDVTPDLPSAPHISALGLVNVNPPPLYGADGLVVTQVVEMMVDGGESVGEGGSARARAGADADGSAAFVGSLLETRGGGGAASSPSMGGGRNSAEADGPGAGPGPSSEAATSVGMGGKVYVHVHHHVHHPNQQQGVSSSMGHHGTGSNHMEHIEVRA